MMNATLRGKPDAGNPHVRFDEGEVASAKPRRGSLLYKRMKKTLALACAFGFGLAAQAANIYAIAKATTGVTPTPPYDTPETAALGIRDALLYSETLFAGGAEKVTIYLAPSTTPYKWYESGNSKPGDEIRLTNAVELVGTGTTFNDVLLTVDHTGRGNSGVTAKRRVIQLRHPQARVENMKIYGGDIRYESYGGGVWLEHGTVTNCHITSNGAGGSHKAGGGVYMTGDDALLTHCLIDNNTSSGNGFSSSSGGGVLAIRGTVANCIVKGNTAMYGGGISCGHAIGTVGYAKVYNCTIVSNKVDVTDDKKVHHGHGGGLYVHGNGSTVRNCVFDGNTSFEQGTGDPEWYANSLANAAAVIKYCAFQDHGDDIPTLPDLNLDVKTCFRFTPAWTDGSYHIAADSPLVDMGIVADDAGATDYDGNPRVAGYGIDIGAYEVVKATPVLDIESSVTNASGKQTVNFYAVDRGAGSALPTTLPFTWTIDGEAQDETTSAMSAVLDIGTHTVAVSVGNQSVTKTDFITIVEPKGVDFSVTPTYRAGFAQVALSGYGSGGTTVHGDAVYNWYWRDENGIFPATPNATGNDLADIRIEPGRYYFKLVVTNVDGAGGTAVREHEEPEVTLTAADVRADFSSTTGIGSKEITLTAVADGFTFDAGAAFAWYWTTNATYDAEASATTAVASHRFTAGAWNVKLVVTDADGAGTNFTTNYPAAITIEAGSDWYVDPKGNDDTGDGSYEKPYATLGKAIDSATDGQTVELLAGSFAMGAKTVTKALTIKGAGRDATTLTVGGQVAFNNAATVITGLALTKDTYNFLGYSFAGCTVTNCTIRNCSPQSTQTPTCFSLTGGLMVDCIIRDNRAGGKTGGVNCASGNATFRNCLFTGNKNSVATEVAYDTTGTGALYVNPSAGQTVTLENCTFAKNTGGVSGALQFIGAGNAVLTGCVIAGNIAPTDPGDWNGNCSADLAISCAAHHVTMTHCHIGEKPANFDALVDATDCTFGPAGYADERAGDWSLVAGSPAYGHGYGAAALPEGFACAVKTPSADRAIGSLALTLEAKLFNAPAGAATYEWDLDGDGTYETAGGATQAATFTTPGWRAVGLKVTVGEAVATYAAENFVYVGPATVYVRATGGSNVFPYDTEANAAKSIASALGAALDGATVDVGPGSYGLSDYVTHVTIRGSDRDSTVVTSSGTYLRKGATACGLKFAGTGANQQSGLALLDDTAVISNCWMYGFQFSSGASPAGVYSRGLVTHSLFTGSHNNYGNVMSFDGTVQVRNTIFRGNYNAGSTSGASKGCIAVAGSATFDNCVVYGNYAGGSNPTYSIGGAFNVTGGSPTFRNCIVRNNTKLGAPGTGTEANWTIASGATPTVANCNTPDLPAGYGTNIQTDDPKFGNPSQGDFSITTDSPCCDKGAPADWIKAPGATDHACNPRVMGWAADIGAYEADAPAYTFDFTSSVTNAIGAQDVTFTLTGNFGTIPAGVAVKWFVDGVEQAEQGRAVTLAIADGRHTVAVDVNDFFLVTKENFIQLSPETVYVVAGNPDAAYPYSTRETAAATLAPAVGAAADTGTTIYLAEGEHTLAADLAVAKNVTIVGEGAGVKMGGAGALTLNAGLLQRVDFRGLGTLTVGAGATARNVIVRNSSSATAAAVLAGGTLENATVWGNAGVGVSNAGTAVNVVAWQNASNLAGDGTFNHCLGDADPLFADPENGDFSFNFESPCYNGGTNSDWAVAADAIDFYGNPRKLGPHVDIGAYEEQNHVASVDFSTVQAQSNGYRQVWFNARAQGFHFAPTAEFQWFWTTPATGTPDLTGNGATARFGSGTYDVWLKVLHADDDDTTFTTNHAAEIVVGATSVSMDLSTRTGGGSQLVAMKAVANGFTLDPTAVCRWYWTNDGTGEPDATGAAVTHTFGVGTYDLVLKVTNANGAGLALETKLVDAIKVYDNTKPVIEPVKGYGTLYLDQVKNLKFKTVNGRSLKGAGFVTVAGADSYRAVIDVADYGAVGDGRTDDTAAIMAAREAAVATGKPLFFPKNACGSTYLTRKGIILASGMVLTSDPGVVLSSASAVLDGGGQTIRTDLAESLAKGVSHVRVDRVAGFRPGQEITIVDKAPEGYSETPADVVAVTNDTIYFSTARFSADGQTDRGAFKNYPSTACILTDFALVKTIDTRKTVNTLIENITLRPCGNWKDPYVYTISPINQTHQMGNAPQNDFRVRNVTIDGSTHDGISTQGSGDIIIENCHVRNVKHKGIHWGTSCDSIEIRGNVVENCGSTAYEAVSSNYGTGGMFFCYNNHRMIIEGNCIRNCFRGIFGFDGRDSGGQDTDSIIAGNVFENCEQVGLRVSGGFHVVVSGNTFRNFGGSSMPLYVQNEWLGLKYSVISGNAIGDFADTYANTNGAIRVDRAQGCVFKDNVVTANPNMSGSPNIRLEGARDCLVTGNATDGIVEIGTNCVNCVKSNNFEGGNK